MFTVSVAPLNLIGVLSAVLKSYGNLGSRPSWFVCEVQYIYYSIMSHEWYYLLLLLLLLLLLSLLTAELHPWMCGQWQKCCSFCSLGQL